MIDICQRGDLRCIQQSVVMATVETITLTFPIQMFSRITLGLGHFR